MADGHSKCRADAQLSGRKDSTALVTHAASRTAAAMPAIQQPTSQPASRQSPTAQPAAAQAAETQSPTAQPPTAQSPAFRPPAVQGKSRSNKRKSPAETATLKPTPTVAGGAPTSQPGTTDSNGDRATDRPSKSPRRRLDQDQSQQQQEQEQDQETTAAVDVSHQQSPASQAQPQTPTGSPGGLPPTSPSLTDNPEAMRAKLLKVGPLQTQYLSLTSKSRYSGFGCSNV